MNEEVESGNKRVCIFILFLLVLVLGERGVWGRLRRRRRRRRVGPLWVVVVCVYL
jgi:hypothetical protein